MTSNNSNTYGISVIIALLVLSTILLSLFISEAISSSTAFVLLSLNAIVIAVSVVIIQSRIEKQEKPSSFV